MTAKHSPASWRMVIATALVGAFIGVWVSPLPTQVLSIAAGVIVLGLLATLFRRRK